jgi:uncharacterized protein
MIHKYRLGSYNIVLDVSSGAVHVVDDVCFDVLNIFAGGGTGVCEKDCVAELSGKYGAEEIRAAYGEIKKIIKLGQLFTDDFVFPEYLRQKLLNSPIKAMCLNVAHDCNLACEYCFAEQGSFGHMRELMSLETACKAIDFLIKNSGSRHNLEVDFFGGEPLMNFSVVKNTVEYARQKEKQYDKKFRFTITTNGLLLNDAVGSFIHKEMENVVLSLDGRREINDSLRRIKSGKSLYDTIVPKYKKFVSNRGDKDYYVRGTFTGRNLDFVRDVMHMYELGFKNISIEPVVADENVSYSIKQRDLKTVFAQYDELAEKIVEIKRSGGGINFFHFMIDLKKSPCMLKKYKGCGCGNEYVAVAPNGDVFPCHQFVGMDGFKMGNLHRRTFDKNMKSMFADNTIDAKDECKNCWAKFYCGGGCGANNFSFEGSLKKPYKISCQMQKKRLECALMIQAACCKFTK